MRMGIGSVHGARVRTVRRSQQANEWASLIAITPGPSRRFKPNPSRGQGFLQSVVNVLVRKLWSRVCRDVAYLDQPDSSS